MSESAAGQDSPRHPGRKLILLLASLSVASGLLVLFATSLYGAGLSPDSLGYVASARNLLAGDGLVDYRHVPLVAQPPAYPLLLAGLSWITASDPLAVARVVNAALLGMIVFMSGLLYHRSASTGSFVVLPVVITAVASPLIHSATMVWSEPMFIASMLAFLLLINAYLSKPAWPTLIMVGAVASLAVLTRYLGVSVIAAGGVTLLCLGSEGWKSRIWRAAVFVGIAGGPLSIWLLRNYLMTATLTGPRYASSVGLLDNLRLFVQGISSWLLPEAILWKKLVLPSLTMVLALSIAGSAVWLLRLMLIRRHARIGTSNRQVASTLLLALAYASALILAATLVSQEIDDRLLAPLFVPLTVLAVAVTSRAVDMAQPGRLRALVSGVFVTGATVVLAYHLTVMVRTTSDRVAHGAGGFSHERWHNSETLARATVLLSKDRNVAFSNVPDALYILAGLDAEQSPSLGGHWLTPTTNREIPEQVRSWPGQRGSFLIWFDDAKRDKFFTPQELKAVADLEGCEQLADGMICSVQEKH